MTDSVDYRTICSSWCSYIFDASMKQGPLGQSLEEAPRAHLQWRQWGLCQGCSRMCHPSYNSAPRHPFGGLAAAWQSLLSSLCHRIAGAGQAHGYLGDNQWCRSSFLITYHLTVAHRCVSLHHIFAIGWVHVAQEDLATLVPHWPCCASSHLPVPKRSQNYWLLGDRGHQYSLFLAWGAHYGRPLRVMMIVSTSCPQCLRRS